MENKSPEEIQSQIAAFASETQDNYIDKRHIMDNIVDLSAKPISDQERTIKGFEFVKDSEGNSVRLNEGDTRPVATGDEYIRFLREVGGKNYPPIRERANVLKEYSRFSSFVDRIKEEITSMDDYSVHPNFMGRGLNSNVFRIMVDGNEYVVRIPKDEKVRVTPGAVDTHVSAAVLARGSKHLEQIVAASYKDGVTISEVMPGKEIGQLPIEIVNSITDEHLRELIETLRESRKKGLIIDPKPSNFLFDINEGFGIVDYSSEHDRSRNSGNQNLGETVGWMAMVFANIGVYGRRLGLEESTLRRQYSPFYKELILTYRSVVEKRLDGEDLEVALENIDRKLEDLSRYSETRKVITEDI